MSTNKSKKPELRFKGFSDDWEQRKLGDFGYVAMCKRIFKDQTAESGDIPFYKIGTFGGEPDAYISRDLFEEYKHLYSYPEKGDILISASGSIGRTVEYTGEDAYYQDSNIVWLKHDKTIVNSFLKHLYEVIRWSGIEGSTIKRLYNDNILKTEVMIPEAPEQEEIGKYFNNLDNLITLHQRKCENLIIIKKSMLDNLFPKNGEKVPRWRFKGFNDDWEQCKLGEIFEEYSEKNHEELPALTIIQGGGTILREESNRNMQYERSSLSGYKMVKKDDFILHLRSFEGGLEKANTNGIISPAYHTFHGENTDSRFYYSFFRSKYFIDVLLKPHVYGIRDGKSIDVEGMKSILVPVPTYNEQKYIGDFVERTDNLITLHQSEVERLKKVKQFFLDKMFI